MVSTARKGGKRHEVPRHHKVEEYVDGYLGAAGFPRTAKRLFRTVGLDRNLTKNRMQRVDALRMIYRRVTAAGFDVHACCHRFGQGASLRILRTEARSRRRSRSPLTSRPKRPSSMTTNDELTLDEFERIAI